MSKYKPGQLVTIDHNVYRIRKAFIACQECAFWNIPSSVCWGCTEKIGLAGYYERV